jgi:hypothetical protein
MFDGRNNPSRCWQLGSTVYLQFWGWHWRWWSIGADTCGEVLSSFWLGPLQLFRFKE